MVEFLVIIICLALNAVFAAVEMAFVTVTKPRLRELARSGNRDARRILALRGNPERTLSVIQIGITIVSAVAAAVGGVSAVSVMSPWIETKLGIGPHSAQALALIAVVLPITYLSVVLGELVPKTLALRNPLGIVLFSARHLMFFDRMLSPVVTLLEASTRAVLALFRPWTRSPQQQAHASGEEAVELDQLSNQTREYVLNLVDLEHKRIRDLRLPWGQAVFVRTTDSDLEVERVVLDSGHTRLPVVDGERVIGIINTKEFMLLRARDGGDWHGLIRPVVRIDEGEPIFRALSRMQEERSHLSITYRDGYRSGIVTIEDIVEEIVGDLFDEDDDGTLKRVLSTAAKFKSYSKAQNAHQSGSVQLRVHPMSKPPQTPTVVVAPAASPSVAAPNVASLKSPSSVSRSTLDR